MIFVLYSIIIIICSQELVNIFTSEHMNDYMKEEDFQNRTDEYNLIEK